MKVYHTSKHSFLLCFDVRLNCPSSRDITAILLKTPSGTVAHARNMDQTPPSAKNLTLRITFTNGADELFEAVDWYWFTTGVMTAVKKVQHFHCHIFYT
eukprot:m.325968 g.325968  ORF g.325968 m.325968 type:complete len:99 (-) comp16016_c0_seq8:6992-7288(-)